MVIENLAIVILFIGSLLLVFVLSNVLINVYKENITLSLRILEYVWIFLIIVVTIAHFCFKIPNTDELLLLLIVVVSTLVIWRICLTKLKNTDAAQIFLLVNIIFLSINAIYSFYNFNIFYTFLILLLTVWEICIGIITIGLSSQDLQNLKSF